MSDLDELPRQLTELRDLIRRAELTSPVTGTPFRQKSAQGQPEPETSIERRCRTCGASFIGLAPGKTGEAGIWSNWRWYCSAECAPAAVRERLTP